MLALALDDFPLLLDAPGFLRLADDKAKALCPCHDDHDPSLDIDIRDGKALGTCRACKANLFAAARRWGLPLVGTVFPIREDRDGHAHPSHAKGRGKAGSGPRGTSSGTTGRGKPKGRIVATYDYRDAAGTLLYQVCRMEPKDFRQRRPDPAGPAGSNGASPDAWLWNLDGITRVPYRLPELLASAGTDPATAPPVFVVEGEKDADRLASLSPPLVATTNAGGAGRWSDAFSYHLRGRSVVVLPDNDDPGRKHAEDVAQSLRGIAASIRVVPLPDLPPKGDVSDWLAAGGARDALLALVAAAPEWTPGPPPAPIEADNDPHRLARLVLDEYRYGESRDLTLRYWRETWYGWQESTGTFAAIQPGDLRARLMNSIKAEFDRLSIDAQAKDAEEVTARKVTRGLVADVEAVLGSLAILPSTTSIPAWLGPQKGLQDGPQPHRLVLRNGILNLDRLLAGKHDPLGPHSPLWFDTVYLPYEFDPAAECPHWLNAITYNLSEDPERIAIAQEFAGYCLSRSTDQQKFLLLHGEGGNGKSVYCAGLHAMLGSANVSAVPLEAFGGRFDLVSTLGKLANISAEIGELDKAAEGILKSFTAGDAMSFERKYKDPVEAIPTARLILSTNNLPRFSDKSGGLWRRMILLPFDRTIPEDRRIRGMDKPEWWRDAGELPGILNWAIDGLRRLLAQGRFTTSPACESALAEYREESNPARQWLTENCREVVDAKVVTRTLYERYAAWARAAGYHALAENTFGREIRRAFPRAEPTKVMDFDGRRKPGFSGIAEGGEA